MPAIRKIVNTADEMKIAVVESAFFAVKASIKSPIINSAKSVIANTATIAVAKQDPIYLDTSLRAMAFSFYRCKYMDVFYNIKMIDKENAFPILIS